MSATPRPVPEWRRPDQHEWCERCSRCANCMLDLQAMMDGQAPLECLGAGRSQRHRCADHPAFAELERIAAQICSRSPFEEPGDEE